MPDGRQRVVRHGYGPERSIQTGIGPLDVRRPKVRDRATDMPAEKEGPLHLQHPAEVGAAFEEPRCPAAGALSAWDLYGGFPGSIVCVARGGCAEPVAGVISRLTGDWQQEYDRWQRRDLSARRYVYIWADGVYLQARMEPQAEWHSGHPRCHTGRGRRNSSASTSALRESAQSWRELLVDIKARGLKVPPEIAVGDGAMGFWKALDRGLPGNASSALLGFTR